MSEHEGQTNLNTVFKLPYRITLCKLMLGQIGKIFDQKEDLKRQIACWGRKIISSSTIMI